MTAAEDWVTALDAWAIPDEILSRAPESPWRFATDAFRRRAERSVASDEPTPTTLQALDALPQGGTVLDIGVGAGSTSLPLASRASEITGVDTSIDMLDTFRDTAEGSDVTVHTLQGVWPDVADDAPVADVVVCGHVLYNVRDLAPFVGALTAHARRRVVVELTGTHPWSWMNDLWRTFHGLGRPDRPTADDAEAVLRELGIAPGREDRVEPGRGSGVERREDAVALIRRRLCLTPDRDAELADALGPRLAERDGLWSSGPERTHVVTFWWDGSAGGQTDRRDT